MGTSPTTRRLPRQAPPQVTGGPRASRARTVAQGAVAAFVAAVAFGVIAVVAGLTTVSDTPDTGPLGAADVLIIVLVVVAASAPVVGMCLGTWVLVRHRDDPVEAPARTLARKALLANAAIFLIAPWGQALVVWPLVSLLGG